MGVSLSAWYINIGKKYLLLVLWAAGCAVLFWRTYCYFKYDPGFYYVHRMLGPWLCISRGSAAVLNLNCGFVLLPMCRSLLTLLRRLNRRISVETMRLILDTCKGFHITCAFFICINAVIHFVAHMFNARNFSQYYNPAIPGVNGAHFSNQDPLLVAITTVPGITGMLMMMILIMIVTSSFRYMRDTNYDLFWYTHRLIVVFYILLLIHALRGPIRKQINIPAHTPGCNDTLTMSMAEPEPEAEYSFHSYRCQEEPKFDSIGCQSWLWIGIPLLLYVIDGAFRMKQRETTVIVTDIIEHYCDVIEIHMHTDLHKPSPGQYVLIQCPRLSVFEWHPYSITKCPTRDRPEISVHIRTRGDWSERLRAHVQESLHEEREESVESLDETPRLKLVVDGPFGGPLDTVLQSRVAVCIAGGIGITPFIAVLNHVRSSKQKLKPKRLYLIWVCRSVLELTWFLATIISTHQHLWNQNMPDFLDIRFHCTDLQESHIQAIPPEQREFVTSRLEPGRPVWPQHFSQFCASHRRETVDVFACGPKGLITDVQRQCLRGNVQKTNFIFHRESF
ncbi:NADPH oxidase 4-like [Haliotis rufescens]|uniref:NADPH oxidase 4-like n=1 Tax=Haliotis rufescens TaxID=6454 RepID=UPI00201F8536|nr:NADPH oxidase 4-like [Haliotis rufescens]